MGLSRTLRALLLSESSAQLSAAGLTSQHDSPGVLEPLTAPDVGWVVFLIQP